MQRWQTGRREPHLININGNTYEEFTVSNIVTTIGNSSNGMQNIGQGNMTGGMQRGR